MSTPDETSDLYFAERNREELRDALIAVIACFEREYQELTDQNYGSIEEFSAVKRARVALARRKS